MKLLKYIFFTTLVTCLSCDELPKEKSELTSEVKKSAKVEVLLIGTSHWNNFQQRGTDIAQSNEIDILSDDYQSQLIALSERISAFNPSKIFVERTTAYQPKLDSLYKLYRDSNWGDDKRNEIYQLGFRVADMLNHNQVFGIDYRETSFNYSEAMEAMQKAGQQNLISKTQESIKKHEDTYNEIVKSKMPLKDILKFLNEEEQRKENLGWYYNIVNGGGNLDDFSGSFLASEWIRRNLHTYALIQKYVEDKDERIMILMGAGHTAVLHDFISYNPEWKIVSLDEVF